MVIFRVGLEVFGEVADSLGEERDLNLGRPRFAVVGLELGDELGLLLGMKRHDYLDSQGVISAPPPSSAGDSAVRERGLSRRLVSPRPIPQPTMMTSSGVQPGRRRRGV